MFCVRFETSGPKKNALHYRQICPVGKATEYDNLWTLLVPQSKMLVSFGNANYVTIGKPMV